MEPEFIAEEETLTEKVKNNFFELFQFIAVTAAILIIIRFFIAEPHRVSGSSMFPNFHDGDYIITNKLAAHFDDFQRGEVIILENPRDANQVFIKRLIGLPLDKIKISDGIVYVNDQVLDEPYLPLNVNTPSGNYLSEGEEIIVPENQFFVIGDNRGGSSDSRDWGPLKKELVIGQAWLRYWPIQKLMLIPIASASN